MREDDDTRTHINNPARGGYIKAVNVNLKALLEVAYDIPDLRMYGGPDWMTKEKFVLEAKVDPTFDALITSSSLEQGKEMKRKMLAVLLADRFRLKVHIENREMPIYAMVVAKGGPKLGDVNSSASSSTGEGEQVIVGSGNDSLAILAYELSWRLGRPVIDRTGFQYRKNLTLRWDDDGAPANSGPSLFTAVQEQLGLKLVSTRGPVPVLVIDHAERPPEN